MAAPAAKTFRTRPCAVLEMAWYFEAGASPVVSSAAWIQGFMGAGLKPMPHSLVARGLPVFFSCWQLLTTGQGQLPGRAASPGGRLGRDSGKSGSRAAAPPAAREGPHGRGLARGLAGAAAGARERRLRGALRAIVQGRLRRAAAPLPAHAAHRAGHGAAARHRPAHHRDRLRDRLGKPGHFRSHLPRHHRREPELRSARARGLRRTSSAACPAASSAPRTGPTSRPQFRRSGAGRRAV